MYCILTIYFNYFKLFLLSEKKMKYYKHSKIEKKSKFNVKSKDKSNNNDNDNNVTYDNKSHELISDNNPYLTQMRILKNKMGKNWEKFFNISVNDRTKEWNQLDKLWDKLKEKYAWAIPDVRTLNILREFSPLIEIGGGKGYWAKLLQDKGCDIVVYDKYLPPLSKCWTKVEQGGPEKLLIKTNKNRNLFLCYPDEQESQAIVCLENFQGDYIIHIGELMTTGTLGGGGQAPYGRTSSSEFQVTLSQSFHCLLVCNLEISLPFGKDCISVWKRTQYVQSRNFERNKSENDDSVEFMSAEDIAILLNQTPALTKTNKEKNEKNDKNDKNDKKTKIAVKKVNQSIEEMREYSLDLQYLENDEKKWANIPLDEILPIDRACSSLKFLL